MSKAKAAVEGFVWTATLVAALVNTFGKPLYEDAIRPMARWVGKAVSKIPGGISRFIKWWNGKTIAIIGATASGKNSMFDRLQGKEPPKEHAQTRGTTKVKNFKINRSLPEVGSISFTCSHAVNVGGEADERVRFWDEACSKADIIFYLVDMEKLRSERERYRARIKDDFMWIDSNISQFQKSTDVRVHILLNKIDKIDGATHEGKDAYKEHFLDLFNQDTLEIERLARSVLGKKAAALSGVTPIHMMDQGLFDAMFDVAMVEIFRTSVSADEELVAAT